MTNFIEIYDNTITKQDCQKLIDYFQISEKDKGIFIDINNQVAVNEDIKKCIQLKNTLLSNKDIISNIIYSPLISCIENYKQKYSGIDKYISSWCLNDNYSFQKFENEDDGYKEWHTEHNGGITANRMLVWMFYLNNAKSGTDFLYHKNINAKEGRCVIWPAAWTHIHKSSLNMGIKYIISGWFSFIN